MTYINEHLTEKLSLQDIADHLQISKTKLCMDFQKYTSMSVHQYIIRERLSLAQQYLNMDYSIEKIAQLCCFGNTSHFVSTFQKYFSISPSQYRIAKKTENDSNIRGICISRFIFLESLFKVSEIIFHVLLINSNFMDRNIVFYLYPISCILLQIRSA